MYNYQLFGGVLRSEIQFPELQPASSAAAPRWTLLRSSEVGGQEEVEHLGHDTVTGEVQVHLYRTTGGLRLVFDDTGCFDLSAAGTIIHWHSPSRVDIRDVRTDLTSRVLAAALHLEGNLCLHGSAVVSDDRAIGLIAPKRHGKSTLALALVRSGGRLLTDDTLPVETGASAVAHPGLHATRLWADSAARVGIGTATRTAEGEKALFSSLPEDTVTHERAPLDALYVLAPTLNSSEQAPVWRHRLSEIESAIVIIGNAKLAPLFGRSEAAVLFRTAARLAQQVPVYRLHVVRDLDRLDEVATTIRAWHASKNTMLKSV